MKVIFVNGAPASGKTTLINTINDDLTAIVLRKDSIKEYLFDTVGAYGEEWSKILGVNISKFVIMLANDVLRTGKSVVIEGAFHRELARKDILWLKNNHADLEVVEIYCEANLDILKSRFQNRIRHEGYHALSLEDTQTIKLYEPIGVGKLVRVNTTDPSTINYEELIAEINS